MGWDLGLESRIWATRLASGCQDWDLGLMGGGGMEKEEEEEKKKEKIPV